jgi:hypothetical protein
MNATLFTATGTTQTITNGVAGQAFQPDLVWTKSRTNTSGNDLNDSVRGASKYLVSFTTGAETTDANFITSFNSNGFSLGTNNYVNGQSIVGWQWKAGGTAVTNTSGTISSQVSANTTSGFSVVTYTGNGGNNQTVGHGLGVAPKMIIIKNRSSATEGWATWHGSLPTKAGYLNDTTDFQTGSYAAYGFNEPNSSGTYPTSSVFYISASGRTYNSDITNGNGNTFVAYCWTPIAGFSQFGSYTGNSSTDGPFIYTGFRPRFLLIKRTDTTGDWWLEDTSRNTYNAADLVLFPNTSGAESGPNTYYWDFLSNGFKLRSTSTGYNASGGTYIYAAFAENPFKYANAR